MLREITGSKKDDLVYSSISAALLAAINGARILRVHDVKATKDALKVYSAVTSQT
jgi:dihydropteroate synthase